MIEVIKKGLETSVQDYPGRLGFWDQGFPPSGPMDNWSFRLANLLVGNNENDAGLECQYMGPTLRFEYDTVIALTGADMQAKIDNEPVKRWTNIKVKKGQILQMSFVKGSGARSYIAIAGGLATEPWLGSRSTFHKAGVGGMEGHAIQDGQHLPVNTPSDEQMRLGEISRSIKAQSLPKFSEDKIWEVEVVKGPNDDWIDDEGHKRFIESAWKLSAKSDRTGFRLDGPDWTFTNKAFDKSPEHGTEPSNIIDQGYPIGAINLAGQTPIILMNDGPSMGGFINPYTVPTIGFWKLGQAKPGDTIKFKVVSVSEAQELRKAINGLCTEDSII
ncbi:biotin-dependent carboxyltransferase family protein [uncultured Amphritea sp.]|uniref:5-oxoprolinase subunit C family protein n=1 Tax=uncultured Amphritea sp. TaxID=981605 RepID=UPI0025FE5ACD|nr:biotin-dependent carboxyltransferase family protein [uncultured Amphritea sp.]